MVEIKCNHCNNVWNTKSDKLYVCCPSCLRKVKKSVVAVVS